MGEKCFFEYSDWQSLQKATYDRNSHKLFQDVVAIMCDQSHSGGHPHLQIRLRRDKDFRTPRMVKASTEGSSFQEIVCNPRTPSRYLWPCSLWIESKMSQLGREVSSSTKCLLASSFSLHSKSHQVIHGACNGYLYLCVTRGRANQSSP